MTAFFPFPMFPKSLWPLGQSNTGLNGNSFNPLPDDKILALSKLKEFADDKSNVTQNIKFICHRVENIVRTEKMLVSSIVTCSYLRTMR